MSNNPKGNKLINSTSPYLKQHSHNPVNWYPWGDEALELAVKEDKPILVSIGYSACHWCHVMEHESFENKDIADLMNQNFISIKVDREERPDIDQIYMDAVHLMGTRGGWPLNVFITPNLNPFYGGTYFPPDGWKKVLLGVANAFQTDRKKVEESAEKIKTAVSLSEIEQFGLNTTSPTLTADILIDGVAKLTEKFDTRYGGFTRAPKFPMPSTWQFLFEYALLKNDITVRNHVLFTLQKMARGGIFDQIGGGFARYSVDNRWFAPHFEKMLYDNGQLLSLYASAFSFTKNQEFKTAISKTIEWLKKEMISPEGGFYSALDADSENEEGKYYVWTEEEIDAIFGSNADFVKSHFNIKKDGNWEKGNNILYTNEPPDYTKEEIEIIAKAGKVLLKHRSYRIKPGLDNKILAGWNGLMLKGLCDSYLATGDDNYLEIAKINAEFIRDNLYKENKLIRCYQSDIPAMLEDYAFVISAYISLYQSAFEIEWIHLASKLTTRVIDDFFDPEERLFYFSGIDSSSLITRKKEIHDNVIPSSNSQMARNLFLLSRFTDNKDWEKIAMDMVSKISPLFKQDIEHLGNWSSALLLMVTPLTEVVMVGEKAQEMNLEISEKYYPFKIMLGSNEETNALTLLENRPAINNETTVYICENKVCNLPVHSSKEALKQFPDFG